MVNGAEFRTQSSIFGTKANVDLTFDLRARYLVPCKFGAIFRSHCLIFGRKRMYSWILTLKPDSRGLLNMVQNLDLRARYSVSTEYEVEFLSQSSMFGNYQIWCSVSIFGICRIWCWISILELGIRYLLNGGEFRSQSLIFCTQTNVELKFDISSIFGICGKWC